jgi:hypothetical protein
MLKSLNSQMKFFESENGYSVKILPADIDNNFRTIANKLDKTNGQDIFDDTIGADFKRDINSIKTTDATQTEILRVALKPKSVAILKIKGTALQDDNATEWAFERDVVVVVGSDGTVTIDVDNNTDLVKDDADWAFDVTGVNDTANPAISLKVTGKDGINIVWFANVETTLSYWK